MLLHSGPVLGCSALDHATTVALLDGLAWLPRNDQAIAVIVNVGNVVVAPHFLQHILPTTKAGDVRRDSPAFLPTPTEASSEIDPEWANSGHAQDHAVAAQTLVDVRRDVGFDSCDKQVQVDHFVVPDGTITCDEALGLNSSLPETCRAGDPGTDEAMTSASVEQDIRDMHADTLVTRSKHAVSLEDCGQVIRIRIFALFRLDLGGPGA